MITSPTMLTLAYATGDLITQGTSLTLRLLKHPWYDNRVADWQKYRLTYNGGRPFIERYLETFSSRESPDDFVKRKRLTYNPAHAKSAILEIRNSILGCLDDIIRRDGPDSYMKAVIGKNGGVDKCSRTMNEFLGKLVVPDLLSIGKIGVCVDKAPLAPNASISDSKKVTPYLYVYQAEDILSWTFDAQNELISLLVCETYEESDMVSGIISQQKSRHKWFKKTDSGIEVKTQNEDGSWGNDQLLKLSMIPFHIFEMDGSLLTDVADYQIAQMNLASSDLAYLLKSNFPFYTEQVNQIEAMGELMRKQETVVASDGTVIGTVTGTSAAATHGSPKTITVGVANGRQYPKNTERPGFINPSSEPIDISMRKQEQMKSEIRQIIHLALTNIQPQRQAADSKDKDNEGLEAGLAYIGMELQSGERRISRIWAEYESAQVETEIIYPDKYSIKTDEDRKSEADGLIEILPKVPSLLYQKEIAKRVADVTIGHKVKPEVMAKIHAEIDAAPVVSIDPAVIQVDHEAGLVSDKTASLARLYAPGEAEQSAKDHASRLARIAIAQSTPGQDGGPRGIADTTMDPNAAKNEKKQSQSADNNPDAQSKMVRGKA